jgi:hypothetical protein
VAPASFRMIPVLAGRCPSLALAMEAVLLTALARARLFGRAASTLAEGVPLEAALAARWRVPLAAARWACRPSTGPPRDTAEAQVSWPRP